MVTIRAIEYFEWVKADKTYRACFGDSQVYVYRENKIISCIQSGIPILTKTLFTEAIKNGVYYDMYYENRTGGE